MSGTPKLTSCFMIGGIKTPLPSGAVRTQKNTEGLSMTVILLTVAMGLLQ